MVLVAPIMAAGTKISTSTRRKNYVERSGGASVREEDGTDRNDDDNQLDSQGLFTPPYPDARHSRLVCLPLGLDFERTYHAGSIT